MTPISEDLQALLDAEREIDVPARAQRERMFERLEPLLLVPVALAAATSASTTGQAAGSGVLGATLKAKIAAAVVSATLLGAAAGAASHAYFAAPAASPPAALAPRLNTVLPRAPEPLEPPQLAHDEPAKAAPLTPSSAAVPALSAAVPASSALRQERARTGSSLRAERLLIETASAALLRGDTTSAIAALRQHARQFPKGDLAAEREVLLAKAARSR